MISCGPLQNLDNFSKDLQLSELISSSSDLDLDTFVDNYDTVLRNILDNHAPLKRRSITIRPSNPWYTPEIDTAKKLRKQLERRWRKTNLEIDRQLFKSQRMVVVNMINDAK